MALDVATLPLILYRIRYITIKHVYITLREHHIYTFLPCYITLPFLLHFFISNVFSTCSCPFSLHSLSIIDACISIQPI